MKNFQNQAKIIKVSKNIRSILFAGLVFWMVAIPGFLAAFLIPLFVLPEEKMHPPMICETCGTALLASLGLVVNLKLFRFFDRLKNGNLFDAQTVGNLDAAGRWWIVLWLFQGLYYQIEYQFFRPRDGLGRQRFVCGLDSHFCLMAVEGSAGIAGGTGTDRLSLCPSSSIWTWFSRSAKCD